MASPELPPLPEPLFIFEHMTAPQTETLVVKEKLFDHFDIQTITGTPCMQIRAQPATIHSRKKVYDSSGGYLFDIIREPMHVLATFFVEDESKRRFMEVKSKFSGNLITSHTVFSSVANATFTTARGKAVTLTMKGNWRDTRAEIVNQATGAVVARIHRKMLNARELLLGQQTYHLSVAPGADMALLVAMCVCLDETQNEGSGAGSSGGCVIL